MTPASEQRLIVIERDFGRCFARDTIEGHTACHDRYGAGAIPGSLECAHLYPAGWIRNRIKAARLRHYPDNPLLSRPEDEIIYDPRNAVPLCPLAHERWDKLGIRCSHSQLPERFLEYLAEYHVTHWARELYTDDPRVEREEATGEPLPW